MLFSHFPCNLFSECFSLYLFHHSSRFTEYILVYHLISTIGLFAIHSHSSWSDFCVTFLQLWTRSNSQQGTARFYDACRPGADHRNLTTQISPLIIFTSQDHVPNNFSPISPPRCKNSAAHYINFSTLAEALSLLACF